MGADDKGPPGWRDRAQAEMWRLLDRPDSDKPRSIYKSEDMDVVAFVIFDPMIELKMQHSYVAGVGPRLDKDEARRLRDALTAWLDA